MLRGPWGQFSACAGAQRAAAARAPQGAPAFPGKCCWCVSQCSTGRGSPGSQGNPLLQLCKRMCVCVFTPQFAMKTQHCFGLGSQLEDAACCLLSSLHRAWGQLDTGLWEWGHARIFLAMFQTCISPEAFPSHSTTLHN